MLEILKRIKESTAYYVKQNKRLKDDDKKRKILGEKPVNQKYIEDNEKRIGRLKEYYEQVASQMKQQANVRRML